MGFTLLNYDPSTSNAQVRLDSGLVIGIWIPPDIASSDDFLAFIGNYILQFPPSSPVTPGGVDVSALINVAQAAPVQATAINLIGGAVIPAPVIAQPVGPANPAQPAPAKT